MAATHQNSLPVFIHEGTVLELSPTTLDCTEQTRQPFRLYHKIGFDTMACKALHATYLLATMDSWAIAYKSNARVRRSVE